MRYVKVKNFYTVRLSFEEKYGKKLHTVSSGTLRYGTKIRCDFFVPCRILPESLLLS